jgi:hypothetical protein
VKIPNSKHQIPGKSQIPSTKYQENPKFQAPNTKQIPNSKHQIPNKFEKTKNKIQILFQTNFFKIEERIFLISPVSLIRKSHFVLVCSSRIFDF